MSVIISIIVALDDKQGIGAKNRLLWHLKKDFQHFKNLTTGHPIIMGRKTFESIGRPLPQRTNIIITRDSNFSSSGCLIAISLESAIALAKMVESRSRHLSDRGSSVTAKAETGKIFIIGGGQIYREAMAKNLVDKLYITHVKGDFRADVFFPDYSHFKLLKQVNGQEGQYHFTFYVFEKH